MYLDFYGLKEYPFNVTSDPSFLYLSDQHREALAYLQYGIESRKGFLEITGEIGAGKFCGRGEEPAWSFTRSAAEPAAELMDEAGCQRRGAAHRDLLA